MLRPPPNDPNRSSGTSGISSGSGTSNSSRTSRSISINTPEINKNELVMEQFVLGQGTFGLVRRGTYNGMTVAVKDFHTKAEIATFNKEVETLSRVNHPNIVKLYGASTVEPCCLVMEYADGGSLYEVIHPPRDQRIVDYNLAHTLSWMYQTSDGVAYLHSLKLVHRDLKPPNLLLVDQGLKIKICDFGTACDVRTHMTTTQGSAAWMAPEVFTSNNYSEKCDVYSFGIILWEVMSRRKPFGDIDGPSFAIMWAAQNGKRPPLLADCPIEIESLITGCWDAEPNSRPTMSMVKEKMKKLLSIFPDDGSVLFPVLPIDEDFSDEERFLSNGAQTVQEAVVSTEPVLSDNCDLYNFLNHSRVIVPFSEPRNVSRENLLDEDLYRKKSTGDNSGQQQHHQRSGPYEDQSPTGAVPRRKSSQQPHYENVSQVDGSKLSKSTSFDDNSNFDSPLRVDVSPPGPPGFPLTPSRPTNFGAHHLLERTYDRHNELISRLPNIQTTLQQQQQQLSTSFNQHLHFADDNRNVWMNEATSMARSLSPSGMFMNHGSLTPISPSHPSIPDFNDPKLNIQVVIDPNLRPLQPDPSDDESMRIYRHHVHESLRFLRIKAEVSILLEREKELYKIGRNECPNVDEEFESAKHDFEELRKFKENLELQVKKIESKKQQEEAERDGFVLISRN